MKSFTSLLIIAATSLSSFAQSRPQLAEENSPEANSRRYAAGISALTSRMDSSIASELGAKGATEHLPARRYAMRDLDGDGKDDLFLITTFEPLNGGNHCESHFFAVLTSRPNDVQHLLVGTSGRRVGNHFQDSGQAFYLHLKVWANSDSQAAPSLSSTEQVSLENGRLVLKPFDAIAARD